MHQASQTPCPELSIALKNDQRNLEICYKGLQSPISPLNEFPLKIQCTLVTVLNLATQIRYVLISSFSYISNVVATEFPTSKDLNRGLQAQPDCGDGSPVGVRRLRMAVTDPEQNPGPQSDKSFPER